MALMPLANREARRAIRRERVFRDRNNPLDSLSSEEVYQRYRLTREGVFQLLERVANQIQHETKVTKTAI